VDLRCGRGTDDCYRVTLKVRPTPFFRSVTRLPEGHDKTHAPFATGVVDIAAGSRFFKLLGAAKKPAILLELKVGFGEGSPEIEDELAEWAERCGGDEIFLHPCLDDHDMFAVRAMWPIGDGFEMTWEKMLDTYDRMAELCGEIVEEFGPQPEDPPAVVNYRERNGRETQEEQQTRRRRNNDLGLLWLRFDQGEVVS